MAIRRKEILLSAREQKAYVQSIRGWSAKDYEREYDKLRNRARNYERLQRAAGATNVARVNVADLLARDARKREYARDTGTAYRASNEFLAISSVSSASPSAPIHIRTGSKGDIALERAAERQFGGILSRSIYTEEITKKIDTAKANGAYSGAWLYTLLRSFADKMSQGREAVAAYNRATPDPARRQFWHSR